jgi:hypothetical protein
MGRQINRLGVKFEPSRSTNSDRGINRICTALRERKTTGSPPTPERTSWRCRDVWLQNLIKPRTDVVIALSTDWPFLSANPCVQLPNTHGADPDSSAWSATGLHTERSRTWGLIPAAIVNRPGSEAISLSNHHRLAVSLTAIQGLVYVDGGPARSARFSPGEISFTPGGV